MIIELKPCPFCGGEAELVIDEPFKGFTFVECHECGSRGSISKERQAIKAWNTRAERTCKPANVAEYAWDDFECSECGWVTWSFLMEHEGCGTVCKPRFCPNCGAKVVEE